MKIHNHIIEKSSKSDQQELSPSVIDRVTEGMPALLGILGSTLSPVLGSSLINKTANLSDFDSSQSAYVERWREGRHPTSVVFLHGFLAEESAQDDWAYPLCSYADKYDCSVYAIRWPSWSTTELLTLVGTLVAAGGASVFTGGSSLLLAMKSVQAAFQRAVNTADELVCHLNLLFDLIQGDLLLVGHSLGARCALKYFADHSLRQSRVTGVLALAPAVGQSEIKVKSGEAVVTYSQSDFVLERIYPIGMSELLSAQMKFESDAIGYVGPRSGYGLVGLNCSRKEIGHSDYCEQLEWILSRREVRTLTSKCGLI